MEDGRENKGKVKGEQREDERENRGNMGVRTDGR